MKRYTEKQIIEFLKAIDRNLDSKQEIIIIGGTAATLAYKFKEATQDIDTANSIDRIKTAIENAAKATGLEIPVSKSGVFDAPFDYESRLVSYAPQLFTNLIVKVPEAIDLILMKTMRLEAHDLSAIRQIIKDKSVSAEQLLSRFESEMGEVTKERSASEFNFLVMIEDCFGENLRAHCETVLRPKT